jgi:ketosteroid isomerase-like protein
MNRRVFTLVTVSSLVALVGLLMASDGASQKKDSGMKDKAEEELAAVEKAWAQAFVKNDAEAIGRFMADDWTIIGPDGSMMDKSNFLGVIKSGTLTHEVMEFDDMKVRVYGDVAVVTSRSTSKGKFKGQAFSELERSSDVFVKQKGQWKCVLTQLTRIVKK